MKKRKMIVEIRGGGFINKGAEMMVEAVIKGINQIDSSIEFALDWDYSKTYYNKSKEYGFYLILQDKIKRIIPSSKIVSFLPLSLRKKLGIVLKSDIDALIDVSGFKYTSQFPIKPFEDECNRFEELHNNGKKVILMPQAFGPFPNDEFKELVKRLVFSVDIIYARDNTSYLNLINIVENNNIFQKPDFTSFLIRKSGINHNSTMNTQKVYLIPNARMLDKTNYTLNNYVEFFTKSVTFIRENGLTPYFLIHAGNEDLDVANKINEKFTDKIEIIEEDNPVQIKNIIFESKFIIASRFHSIASALYLSVPVIGTGWSHKYNELFNDFNQSNLLVNNVIEHDVNEKINFILNNYCEIVEELNKTNKEHDILINELFTDVVNKLNY